MILKVSFSPRARVAELDWKAETLTWVFGLDGAGAGPGAGAGAGDGEGAEIFDCPLPLEAASELEVEDSGFTDLILESVQLV